MNIKEYIKEISKDIGIDIVGITDGSPLDLRKILNNKIKTGKITEFEENDLERRLDPKLTMESTKSIIVVGVSYNTGFKTDKTYDLSGSISMSSWGQDYHKVVKERMDKLILEIKKIKEFDYKAFVDTGPLVDRELARKAGVGFYGRNCSIINKDYGSFIFIGYILTDIEIKADLPLNDDCGDCDLCLKACPTGALESEYNLNPQRCISYLSQTKKTIPVELRQKMGRSIYGCDICQKVCPKNKDVKFSCHSEFIPSPAEELVDLKKLLSLSNRDFKREFGHMAGSWRGRNILKRNAIIAIGNMKDNKNIQLLLETKENSKNLEEYIDWAIENILMNSKDQ